MDRSVEQALHRALYLSLQRLRARPIGAQIKILQQWESLDHVEFEKLMHARLLAMLRYARETVPLYTRGPWRERLSQRSACELSSWPILERSVVRSAASLLRAKRPIIGVFHRESSASTGEPLRVAWDPTGSGWGWANEYRAMLWHGVMPGTRTLLMWGAGRAIDCWVKNCRLFLTTELSSQRLEEATQYLFTERPGLCQGLPSAVTRLARYVDAHHPKASHPLVPFAKLGGEQVYPFQRDLISRSLGARVVETYGCTEVGPIAAECPAGSLHVLSANVHLEICRDNEPVPAGESGDIVVTSLSNRAMPLIRCKNGDRGSLSPDPCACGLPQPVLSSLVGRAADVFLAANGTPVHGSILGLTMDVVLAEEPPDTIQQTLFMQLDQRHWRVLVESDGGFTETTAGRLAAHVRKTFGDECHIEVERVALVPREPSGKFRYYRVARDSRGTPTARVETIDGRITEDSGQFQQRALPLRAKAEVRGPR